VRLELANVNISQAELEFLKAKCPYLTSQHLHYLKTFSLRPNDQVHLTFHSKHGTGADDDVGDIELHTSGLWVETILYEIPLLALISETYFKFCDTEWSYDSQVEEARNKGVELLKAGCIFSEFGSRRRRDYKTQELVLEGLVRAAEDSKSQGWTGKLSGSSNVHFAMRFGLEPVGTVAHEWFMGVAAITGNYEEANETSLAYWVKTFGEGVRVLEQFYICGVSTLTCFKVLGIALTDTFGTQAFLRGFKKPIPPTTTTEEGPVTTLPSVGEATPAKVNQSTTPPVQSSAASGGSVSDTSPRTFAQVFGGVRQDSGDPEDFILMMRQFYDSQGITEKKVVVFSDSLNVELCLKYKSAAEAQGFQPTFGVGTFLTSESSQLPSNGLLFFIGMCYSGEYVFVQQ
jgi:nicotinate phosphoribosyltransferase